MGFSSGNNSTKASLCSGDCLIASTTSAIRSSEVSLSNVSFNRMVIVVLLKGWLIVVVVFLTPPFGVRTGVTAGELLQRTTEVVTTAFLFYFVRFKYRSAASRSCGEV